MRGRGGVAGAQGFVCVLAGGAVDKLLESRGEGGWRHALGRETVRKERIKASGLPITSHSF